MAFGAVDFNLTKEDKILIGQKIESFYKNERDEEIGVIQREQLTDFFTNELAAVIYNRALDDAVKWYMNRQEDMQADYYSLYKDIRK